MGYFEGITEAAFKKDSQGRTLFFPWGVIGKGRVLRDEAQESELRRFLIRYYQVTLVAIVVLAALRLFIPLLAFGALAAVHFVVRSRALLADAPVADDQMTMGEAYRNSAAKHSRGMLWLLLVSSLLFVAAGVWFVVSARSGGRMALGASTAAFFGACAAAMAYMIRVRPRDP